MYINRRFGWIMRNICCNFIDYHGYCGIARVWIQIFATIFPRKKCVSNNMLHILSVLFQFVYGIWNSFHVISSKISGLRSNSNTPQSTFIDLSLPFYTRASVRSFRTRINHFCRLECVTLIRIIIHGFLTFILTTHTWFGYKLSTCLWNFNQFDTFHGKSCNDGVKECLWINI